MQLRGISYDGDALGDPDRDLRAIRDQLHCTTVLVYGANLDNLREVAQTALDAGLDVWFQPRLADRPRRNLLRHLAEGAAIAEELRTAHPQRVVFVAGCEHSLFSRGMIPGPHTMVRLRMLRFMPRLRKRVAGRLNALLAQVEPLVRARFAGPVTYAAAYWEDVEWARFDLVGVNLYRMGDGAGYEARVRSLVADKPVVITEFGCAAHVGADRTGPAGFMIVKWLGSQPSIRPGHVRDEQVQARYLAACVDVYERVGVHGAFAFTFLMPEFPHRPDDPEHDLDMAGFGVVKVAPEGPEQWAPKAGFHALARAYGA